LPYTQHREFDTPEEQTRIWRFMDLGKLIWLIDKSALYFSRLDKLSSIDPFEGLYTRKNFNFQNLKFEDQSAEWKQKTGLDTKEKFEHSIQSNRWLLRFVKTQREVTFVNCWHSQEYESAAMWKMYVHGNEGVAIQSSVGRLKEALSNYTDFKVFIGRIKYIDYNKEAIASGNILIPFLHKRKSYEYEKELRALIWTIEEGKNDISNNRYANTDGLEAKVNLENLIEMIYLAPTAPTWIRDLLTSLFSKYGLTKAIVQSSLCESAFY